MTSRRMPADTEMTASAASTAVRSDQLETA